MMETSHVVELLRCTPTRRSLRFVPGALARNFLLFDSSISREERMVFLLQLFALYPELVDRRILDSYEVATYLPEELVEVRVVTDVRHPAYGQAGLYAKRTIPSNTLVTPYSGFIEIFNTSCNSRTYTMGFGSSNDDYALDAEFAGNFGRYANDPRGVEGLNANLGAESRFNSCGESFTALVARRQIYEGEEILMSYGKAHSLSPSAWMDELGRPLARAHQGGVLPCPQIARPQQHPGSCDKPDPSSSTTTAAAAAACDSTDACYRLMWECSQCGSWTPCAPTMHVISYCHACGTPKLSGVKMVHMLQYPCPASEDSDSHRLFDATATVSAHHAKTKQSSSCNRHHNSNATLGVAAAGLTEGHGVKESDCDVRIDEVNCGKSRLYDQHKNNHRNTGHGTKKNNNNNSNANNNGEHYDSVRVDWPLNVPFVPWQIWDPAVPLSAVIKNSRFDTHEHVFLYNVYHDPRDSEATQGRQCTQAVSQRRQRGSGTADRSDVCDEESGSVSVCDGGSVTASIVARAEKHDEQEHTDSEKTRREGNAHEHDNEEKEELEHKGVEGPCESTHTVINSFSDILSFSCRGSDTTQTRTHSRPKRERGGDAPSHSSPHTGSSSHSTRIKSDEMWAKRDGLSEEEACYIDSRRVALSAHSNPAAASFLAKPASFTVVTHTEAARAQSKHSPSSGASDETCEAADKHVLAGGTAHQVNHNCTQCKSTDSAACCPNCSSCEVQSIRDFHSRNAGEPTMNFAHIPRLSDILPMSHEVERLIMLQPRSAMDKQQKQSTVCSLNRQNIVRDIVTSSDATATAACHPTAKNYAGQHSSFGTAHINGKGKTIYTHAHFLESGPVRRVQRILSSLTRRIFAGVSFQPGDVVANLGGVLRYRHDTRCCPDNSTLVIPMKYILPRVWRLDQQQHLHTDPCSTGKCCSPHDNPTIAIGVCEEDVHARNAQDLLCTLSMLELVVTNEMMYCPCLLLPDEEDDDKECDTAMRYCVGHQWENEALLSACNVALVLTMDAMGSPHVVAVATRAISAFEALLARTQ